MYLPCAVVTLTEYSMGPSFISRAFLARLPDFQGSDRLSGILQELARTLGSIPDTWSPYEQCGHEYDGMARFLLEMLQVAPAFRITYSLSFCPEEQPLTPVYQACTLYADRSCA